MTTPSPPIAHDSHPTQAEDVDQNTVAAESLDAIQLYLHSKRPQWGLAIRVRQRGARYDFQFKDGRMRAIGQDFLHLLTAVDRPADETSTALRELTQMSGLVLARNERERGSDTRAISLDEQISWFLQQYEGGFTDGQWVKKIRGSGQARRTKTHREAAVAQAQQLLAVDELDRLLEQMRADEIVARAKQVLQATSLISKAQLRPLQELTERQYALFAKALRSLLFDTEDFELRFAKLLRVFHRTPTRLSWSVATVWLALVHPNEHLCVHPNVLAEQSRWMAPTLSLPKQPDGRVYLRLRDMISALRDELDKRGLVARDLLDLYDFVWCTLRPAARKAILAQPPAPRSSEVRMAGEETPSETDSQTQQPGETAA